MAVAEVEVVTLEPLVVVRKVVQPQMVPLVEEVVAVQVYQQVTLVVCQHIFVFVLEHLDLLVEQVV